MTPSQSTESALRDEMCRVGASLFARGYVHATAGNISVRLPDGYLITPTDACLGFLDPSKLAKIDANLQHISGDKASKTMALHAAIYAATHELGEATSCIIHTHSTHCVALSLQADSETHSQSMELLPAITPYFVMKVGHVPLIPYHRPGDPAAGVLVAQAIKRYAMAGTPIRAAMLARLGPNVWHANPKSAMATLEELEETAKLWHMSSQQPSPLTPQAVQELRQTFGAHW
jgi:3-dehydro-4-phosphotetronate decarboxylase